MIKLQEYVGKCVYYLCYIFLSDFQELICVGQMTTFFFILV